MSKLFDKIGICVSALCLIHCILMPFVLLVFPAFSSQVQHVDHDELNVHLIFGVFVLLSAIFVIYPHCKKAGRKDIIAIISTGAILVFTGFTIGHDISELAEHTLTIAGSLVLIFGHYKNLKTKHTQCEDDQNPCSNHH